MAKWSNLKIFVKNILLDTNVWSLKKKTNEIGMIDGLRNTFLLRVNTRSWWAVTITRSDYNPIPPGLLHFNLHHFVIARSNRVRCTLSTIEGTINIYVSTEASWRTAKGIDSTKGPHAGHIENTIGTSMRAYSLEY